MSIGERLKYWRTNNNLTMTDISKKTGLSTGGLSDYENDKKVIGSKTLLTLYEHYNLDINWILTGEKNENILDEVQDELLQFFNICDKDTKLMIIKMVRSLAITQQSETDKGKSSSSKTG